MQIQQNTYIIIAKTYRFSLSASPSLSLYHIYFTVLFTRD